MADQSYELLNHDVRASSSYNPNSRETGKQKIEIQPKNSELPSYPKYGVTSVCGRRRYMEDAVTVHPSFLHKHVESGDKFHYYAVYDGHGCSHASMKCKERLHEIVKEELKFTKDWNIVMKRSFMRMDTEVINVSEEDVAENCTCKLKPPKCDLVGTTAIVAIVTPTHIIVANCGDSRAVISRNGMFAALSSDHKPDHPHELKRINDAGGKVFNLNVPRVFGLLAMSRAIGDKLLKPYVICEPDVVIMERSPDDDCLILASDGLWDMVSNKTACGVAHAVKTLNNNEGEGSQRGLKRKLNESNRTEEQVKREMDQPCSDTSILLMRLALARKSSDNISVIVVDLKKKD